MPDRKPAFRTFPDAYSRERAKEAIDLAASIDFELDDWQERQLKDALGVDEDEKWSANEVGLVVPRQNGKTAVAEIRAIAGMCLWNEPLQLWTAHRVSTCDETFFRIASYFENYPHLSKLLRGGSKGIHRGAGDKSINLISGARLRFIARATGTGRGFTADTIYLDEAYDLNDTQMASLFFAKSARPNSQIWYLSSAPQPDSFVLRELMKRGRAGSSPRLAYTEFSAPLDAAIDDEQAWLAANPAYPSRISADAITDEISATSEWLFRIERLGQVDLSEQVTTGPIDLQAWIAGADSQSEPSGAIALGVDVRNGATTIAAAGRRSDGLGHGEIVKQADGTGWVVAYLVEFCDKWNPSAVVIDPGSYAGALEMPLLEAGFNSLSNRKLELISARSLAQASVALTQDINEGRFRHLGDGLLTAAVNGAKTRPLAGSWTWNSKDSGTDISPLVALTLARHGHAVNAVSDQYISPTISWA